MKSWRIACLSEILTDARPGFACGEDVSNGMFQFRMNNVTAECMLDYSKKRRIPSTKRNLDLYLLEPGDVLFNATNSPELVGKSAFFPGYNEPAVFSNHYLRLRPDTEVLDGRYLARWLAVQFRQGLFQKACHQWVNQASVGRDVLLALKTPLPPLAAQRGIADVLDGAEALRAKRREALALLDTLTQSIFLEMFGNVVENERGWISARVAEAGRVQLGRQRAPQYQSGKYTHPYMRVANVYEDRIDLSDVLSMDFDKHDFDSYGLEYGDILLNEGQSTELVGRPAIWRNELSGSCFQNTLVRFQSDRSRTVPEFALAVFLYYFRSGAFAKISSKTSNVAHLGAGRFAAMPFPLPPLPLQREFARRVAAVEKLKESHRASLKELDALFASLQHRAFRGEL